MPPDNAKSTRRSSRKVIEDEDLEIKRIRGEISCAECRRLKLRCDKKVPCASCVRRGCSSICPNGSLSSGQGTRFILADTEHLHRKIAEMSKRIRQLEDALAIYHTNGSSERHPLLSDELLKIKFGPEAFDLPSPNSPSEEPVTHTVDALGTLSLGSEGEIQYYGRSAGSETLLLAGEESDATTDDDDVDQPIPPELVDFAERFPFTMKREPTNASLRMLESFLPMRERAWTLAECFLSHASWHFRPFDRDELMNDLLTPIYNVMQNRANAHAFGSVAAPELNRPHALASLFFVFAVGALVDLSLPPYSAEASRYADLGRAALGLKFVFDGPQVETVQAVSLLAMFHSLADKDYSRDSVWSILALAAKLAQSIGLHRDSSRWDMDAKTVQRRRALFWEIYTAETSVALALGRPPSIHSSYIDCEFPLDQDESLSESGETQRGFWWWKHTFAKDIFTPVIEVTLTAKPPGYTSSILDLDRKVRQMSFPTSFKPYAKPGDENFHSASASIRSFYLSQHRTVIMLYIHRSFFAQALLDHPANPLRSPFAPSFLAAYRCASIIIKAFVHQYERAPELTTRVWFLLNHVFSAAIIVGSVVSRVPSSNMAPTALVELGLAVDVFEKMAPNSRRARVALRVLRKLRDKGARAYAQFRTGSTPAPVETPSGTEEGHPDELAIFGGQIRVISSKTRSRRSTITASDRWRRSPTLSTSSSADTRHPSTGATTSPIDIHPSLLEYLDILPGTTPTATGDSPQDQNNIFPLTWTDPVVHGFEPPSSSLPPPSTTLSPIPDQPQTHSFTPFSSSRSPTQPLVEQSMDFSGPPMMDTTGNELLDLGLSSESGIDDQWLSFMRECGILDGSFDGMNMNVSL